MFEEIHNHWLRYLVLTATLFLGLVFFILSAHDPGLQLKIVSITLAAYVLWGIIHHHLDRDLTAPTVVEYLLVAVVAFMIIFSLLRFA